MSVKLGTVAAIGFKEFPPQEWLACFRQLGCTVVQAYRNQAARVSIQEMTDAIAAGGMPCDSLHGVFGEEFDPSATLEDARRFAVDTYRAEGELCLKLGGRVVIVHCSPIRPVGVSAPERLRRLEQLKKSFRELGQAGQRMGVQYAFENLPSYFAIGSDLLELSGLLEQAVAPNTGICFDAGHANMVGDAADLVPQAGGRILYVHLSDNDKKADHPHLPGYGTMDTRAFARSLAMARYDGTLMLEVFYPVDRLQQVIAEGCAEKLAEILRIANSDVATEAIAPPATENSPDADEPPSLQ